MYVREKQTSWPSINYDLHPGFGKEHLILCMWPPKKDATRSVLSETRPSTSLGKVNRVAPIDRNFIDISAIIRLRLRTFELPIE
jgi:hypothetical protein